MARRLYKMTKIRIIFINIGVCLALLGALVITPPTAFLAHRILRGGQIDKRMALPVYEGVPWIGKHFEEFHHLDKVYYDYIGWRTADQKGQTINIKDGLRETIEPIVASSTPDKTFKFFGGSTTWGTGVSDEYTYPSMFVSRTGYRAKNYGESGYIARQSFASLANLYAQVGPEYGGGNVIVFYDGVNEVALRCRAEIEGLATVSQHQIREQLSADSQWSFRRPFSQIIDFGSLVIGKFSVGSAQTVLDNQYICDSQPERALEVADTLTQTWVLADELASSKGDQFVAILQPVAFFGKPYLNHLDLSGSQYAEMAKQYPVLYPLIKEKALKSGVKFLDMSNVYDGETPLYIDFCHVGPVAHGLLVGDMEKAFKRLGI